MSGDSMFNSLVPQLPWLSSSVCLRLTTTLLHSLWQASVIAGLFAVVDFGLRRGSANARYWSGVVSLGLIVLCSLITFGLLPAVNDVSVTDAIFKPQFPVKTSSTISTADGLLPSASSSSAPATDTMSHTGVPARQSLPFVKVAPWVAAVYLFGVVVMLLRLVIAIAASWRMRWNSVEVVDDRLREIVRRTAERWAIRVVPVVVYCHRISVPVITGTLRPMILIPPALMTGLTVAQVELVLAHELAHLRRGDLLINWLQRVVEAIFFFHPAVWYLSHRISLERECTCDDLVVASGCPAFEYAEALVHLADICGARKMPSAPFAALLAATGRRPSQLKYRLLRLLGEPAPRMTRVSVGGLMVTAGFFALGLAGLLHPLEGQSSDRREESVEVEVAQADDSAQVAEITATPTEPVLDPVRHEQSVKAAFASSEGQSWYEFGTFSKIVVEGNATIPEAEMFKYIKSRPERPMTTTQIKDDVDALMRTRWFVSVEPKLRPSDEGGVLIFRVIERPIVRRVEYKGLKTVKQKVFDNMTQLKPGSPFDVRSNRECARRIEEYYHEKGFAFATVELEKGNDRDDREVVFAINEGPKVHVTAVKFDGQHEVIDGIVKTKTRSKTRILQLFGGKYDPSTMKDDMGGIKQYYHSLGYFDVVIEPRLLFSEDESSLKIHYDVYEGLRYKVRNVDVFGNATIPEEELRDLLISSIPADYNAHQIDKVVDLIKTKYIKSGCPSCRVAAVLKWSKDAGVVDLDVKVVEDPYERGIEARIARPANDPTMLRYLRRQLALKQTFEITRNADVTGWRSEDSVEGQKDKSPE